MHQPTAEHTIVHDMSKVINRTFRGFLDPVSVAAGFICFLFALDAAGVIAGARALRPNRDAIPADTFLTIAFDC